MGSALRLTGVAGRWSAGHPWTAIAAWLGAVAVLMVTGHLAGTLQLPYGALPRASRPTEPPAPAPPPVTRVGA